MKNSMILSKYVLALTLSATTIFVGCADGKHSSKGTQPGATEAQGTTDGAGGNGTKGKAYDSYIVNPKNLEAYKKIIEPKIKAMDKAWRAELDCDKNSSPDPEEKAACAPPFEVLWGLKTWYIAPLALNTLNKKTIGVEFTEDKTEQLALQTSGEIWIDSRYFEKMSLKEQADLLMHEFVMNLYLVKFKRFHDLCLDLSRLLNVKPKCNTFGKDHEMILGAEADRPLQKQDYEHIRATTATFMEKGEKMTGREISNNLITRSFDKRFFQIGSNSYGYRGDVQLPATSILSSFKVAARNQSINGLCQGLQTKAARNCKLEVEVSTQAESPLTDLSITLVDSENGNTLRKFSLKIFDKVHLSDYGTIEKENLLVFGINEQNSEKEGSEYARLDFVFERQEGDWGSPRLLGLVARKAIVASVINSKETQDGKEVNCQISTHTLAPIKDFNSDILVMGAELQKMKSFFELQMYTGHADEGTGKTCGVIAPERTSFNNSAATVN